MRTDRGRWKRARDTARYAVNMIEATGHQPEPAAVAKKLSLYRDIAPVILDSIQHRFPVPATRAVS